MPKNKPYEIPLDATLAEEVLNMPLTEEVRVEIPRTIGERLRLAMDAITEANHYLEESPLAEIVAKSLMKSLKKRGYPLIRVRMDGLVILRVSYDRPKHLPKAHNPPVLTASRKSELPFLDELREEADTLGIDITDLGRARRRIYERIIKTRAALHEEAQHTTHEEE